MKDFFALGEVVEREYKILKMLDFTSKRKHNSVIVHDEEGSIILLGKGYFGRRLYFEGSRPDPS